MGEELTVSGAVVEWRGPAPYHFVVIEGDLADHIRAQAASVTYGWGMIPVSCTIGVTSFTTSLWPRGGAYYLPLKDAVRAAERIDLDDVVSVKVRLRAR